MILFVVIEVRGVNRLRREFLSLPAVAFLAGCLGGRSESGSETRTDRQGRDYDIIEGKYFAANGAGMPFYDIIQPQGLYVDTTHSTYVVWQGKGIASYICEYSHKDKSWGSSVKIRDHPAEADYHGGPSLVRDQDGYIHVFYGSHGSNQLYSRSKSPDDITAWEHRASFEGGFTYPKPVVVDGRLHLFMRRNEGGPYNVETHYRSKDNGENWQGGEVIIDHGEGWTVYTGGIATRGDEIHLGWVAHDHETGKRLNVYHARLNPATGNLRAADGTDIGSRVSADEAEAVCKVFDSGESQCSTVRCKFDRKGALYLFFKHNDPSEGWVLKWTKWDGSSWRTPQTITSVGHKYNSHEEIVSTASDIKAYVTCSDRGRRSGKLQRLEYDGSEWSLIEQFRSSDDGVGINNPQIVRNHVNELEVVFAEEDYEDIENGDLRTFAYGEGGFV